MYDPRVNGRRLEFAVSGLLYKHTALLYDTATASLWSQHDAAAVSGPHDGTRLATLRFDDTTWGDWRARHPDTLVLSTDTGFARSYGVNPYGLRAPGAGAASQPAGVRQLAPEDHVFGVVVDGLARAYPARVLAAAPERFTDRVGETDLHLINRPRGVGLQVTDADGEAVPAVRLYWYVWHAFHPTTSVYRGAAGTPLVAEPECTP